MKLWVALVAATLLAGCGAELSPPEATPPPPPPGRIWGFLGALGGAAENVTTRLRGAPFVQRLQSLVKDLKSLGATLRADVEEAGERAAEYGAEARAMLEQSWGELRNRGATYARKLRKRLSRDGEELRRRWDALGERAAALGRSWGAGEKVWGDPPAPRLSEV